MCECGREVLVTDGAHATKCACAGLRVCDPLELVVKAVYQIWDLEEEERERRVRGKKEGERGERGERWRKETRRIKKKWLNSVTELSVHTHPHTWSLRVDPLNLTMLLSTTQAPFELCPW